MNNARRKQLKALLAQIDVTGLEALRDEEQDYYDNMPESLQNSEKGEKASEIVDAITALIDGLEEGISTIEDAAGLSAPLSKDDRMIKFIASYK